MLISMCNYCRLLQLNVYLKSSQTKPSKIQRMFFFFKNKNCYGSSKPNLRRIEQALFLWRVQKPLHFSKKAVKIQNCIIQNFIMFMYILLYKCMNLFQKKDISSRQYANFCTLLLALSSQYLCSLSSLSMMSLFISCTLNISSGKVFSP